MNRMQRTPTFLGLSLLLISSLFGPNTDEGQTATNIENDESSLLFLENVPQVSLTQHGDDQTVDLTPLRLTEGGGFEEASIGLSWQSSNQSVATIGDNGDIQLTGNPGDTTITVSDDKNADEIKLEVDNNAKLDIIQEDGNYDVIKRAIDELTLEERIGQMMMPDYRTWENENVTEMLPEIEEQLKKYHIGGVILFAENTVETEQTAELVYDYKQAAEKFGMLVTIDQEGGIVTRLQEGTDMPGNMAVGATRDEDYAFEAGKVIGAELDALGINMNLGPVVDVNNNPDNPVIGVRSFAEQPELVGELGTAYTKGMQEQGIAGIAKHFPGHGDTDIDSHIGLPEVPHDRDRLFDVELTPFQKAMDEGLDAIMTSHVTFPKIDDTTVISEKDGSEISLPATLSEDVLTGLVREDMDYDGVIMTDALNMDAIAEHFDPVEAAIRTINAGTDIVLMPVGLPDVFAGIHEAVKTGDITEERINEAVERVLTLKLNRGILKQEEAEDLGKRKQVAERTTGSLKHIHTEQEIADASITLVKNDDDALPISSNKKEHLTVIGEAFSAELAKAIEDEHDGTVSHILLDKKQDRLTAEEQALIGRSDHIVIGSHSVDFEGRSPNHPHMQVYQQVTAGADVPVTGVGIRNPYDVMAYPDVDAYIAQYGFREASFIATAKTLFAENNPTGKLPVTIYDENDNVLFPYGHGLSYDEENKVDTQMVKYSEMKSLIRRNFTIFLHEAIQQ
ncbi:glycoside hydrolase family 3 protein [Texcoconibacillus texcoconensis]|uniref:beta-N-acetylhexosaminidase n=1 Tax=Texcoconibacillus texcoconensis TaxID=1095777 RepID=A0A840QPY7_9BACI|nr:glycoside hydrolase family 3 N-terminal domain-containing protein [Texcoconibacillus texcoconensis]MBB5173408.1 beta-N-acetylhexosaminidase [Texcoconibacillus texcoconensis]